MLSQAKKRLVRGIPAILAGGVAAYFSGRLTDSVALGTAFVVVGISTGGLLTWAAARLAGRKWDREYVLAPVAGYCAAGAATLCHVSLGWEVPSVLVLLGAFSVFYGLLMWRFARPGGEPNLRSETRR